MRIESDLTCIHPFTTIVICFIICGCTLVALIAINMDQRELFASLIIVVWVHLNICSRYAVNLINRHNFQVKILAGLGLTLVLLLFFVLEISSAFYVC